jgi:hypothetical protein
VSRDIGIGQRIRTILGRAYETGRFQRSSESSDPAPVLVCDEEGDVDFSGLVDITDLSVMIDNQFLTLTPLPPCS